MYVYVIIHETDQDEEVLIWIVEKVSSVFSLGQNLLDIISFLKKRVESFFSQSQVSSAMKKQKKLFGITETVNNQYFFYTNGFFTNHLSKCGTINLMISILIQTCHWLNQWPRLLKFHLTLVSS